MLCCLETPWFNDRDSRQRQRQTGDFPGNRRRFVPTAGNALAAPPSSHDPAINGHHQQQHSSPSLNGSGGNLVQVTIPPGVSPGQSILVAAPNGSGRTVSATVPQGLTPGSSFMVRFPPEPDSSSPADSVVTSGAETSSAAPPPPSPAHILPEPVDYSNVEVLPPPLNPQSTPAEPFAQAVPIGAGPWDTTISAPEQTNRRVSSPMPATFGQPMLRVQVPPGTVPGSTLHISIPGENRTIPAVVPAGNVSSFHVPYEPQQQQQQQQQHQQPPAAAAATPIVATNARAVTPPRNSQKLLLVRVPPGTQPGTILHVSIPDEPGRIVAAPVPPNVSEFQIAYQPLSNNGRFGQSQRNSHGQVRNSYNSNGRNSSSNNNRNGSGMMGSMLLPALGGAALGMTGMGMYDHFRHNNDYGESNNVYGDSGNDFSGGGVGDGFGADTDFGGGFE